MSGFATSAPSTVSPDLKLRSSVRPDLQVADADAVERLALAGLHELVLDDHVRIAVEQDLEAGLEFVRAVSGHGCAAPDGYDWPMRLNRERQGPTIAGCLWLAAHDTRNPPRPSPAPQPAWQQALRDCGQRPPGTRGLPWPRQDWVEQARRAAARFPLRVPRSFVARMRHGDPTDPLLRQVLPLDAELLDTPGYRRGSGGRSRRPCRTGPAAQVPRPRAARDHGRLRDPLPLLLPARVSVRRAARGPTGLWRRPRLRSAPTPASPKSC